MSVTKSSSKFACCLGLLGLLVLGGPPHAFAKLTPEQKCIDAKAKVAADTVYAATQCFATAVLAQTEPEQACFDKVIAKLQEGFAKAEAKGTCAGTVDDVMNGAGGCINGFGQAV